MLSRHGILWVLQPILETFLKAYCSRRTVVSSLQKLWNLSSSSCGLGPSNTVNIMEHGAGVKRESLSSSTPTPRFNQGILSHTGGTYSFNGMMDYPRYPISEMHLGKFPDSLEFH